MLLLPPMMPPKVSVFAPTVIVRLVTPREIAPVFWVRLAVPVKLRSAPRVTALVIVASTEALSVPPLMVNVPAVPPLPPNA